MRLTIIFVYNADSGLFNTLADMAHKTFAPETYSCNLCAITFGTFGMRSEWRHFLESLDIDMEFLHRNELQEQHRCIATELPAIFIKKTAGSEQLITAGEINACSSMAELKKLIVEKLAEHTDQAS